MKIVNKIFFVIFLGVNIPSVFAVQVNAPIDQILVVKGITDNVVTGEEMAGMQISVNGAASEWNGISASGEGWVLSYTGTDTWVGRWTFSSTTALVNTVNFDGFGANAVFDKISNPHGTEGSDKGSYFYHSGPDVEVTYPGPVKIDGSSAPFGDLSRWISFDFSGGGGFSAQSFEFTIDSDRIEPIPLPSSVILLVSALLALFSLRRHSLS